jgi:acyl-CoA thioester hydrolase
MIASDTKVRVRYADTDQMKFAYYGTFFAYFEEGRSDLLRQIGMSYPEIERMGYYLPVIEAHARYLRSARYDDLLVVRSILRDPPQVRIRIEYEVRVDGNADLLAEGYTVHSFMNAATGRPTRAPEDFINVLKKAMAR